MGHLPSKQVYKMFNKYLEKLKHLNCGKVEFFHKIYIYLYTHTHTHTPNPTNTTTIESELGGFPSGRVINTPARNARGAVSISVQGTQIPHAAWRGQENICFLKNELGWTDLMKCTESKYSVSGRSPDLLESRISRHPYLMEQGADDADLAVSRVSRR